jgi:hypothetical protein
MEYQQVVTAVNTAVRQDINTVNKWQLAGHAVREFYGTETAINETKAQFIADAIIPAMDKKHAAALLKDNARKGSAEYNALDSAGRDAWEAINQAKKDARAIAHTMYARVVKYAFPSEKVESAPTPTKTKIIEAINDAIKKAQKDEAPDYDAVALIAALQSALAIASK